MGPSNVIRMSIAPASMLATASATPESKDLVADESAGLTLSMMVKVDTSIDIGLRASCVLMGASVDRIGPLCALSKEGTAMTLQLGDGKEGRRGFRFDKIDDGEWHHVCVIITSTTARTTATAEKDDGGSKTPTKTPTVASSSAPHGSPGDAKSSGPSDDADETTEEENVKVLIARAYVDNKALATAVVSDKSDAFANLNAMLPKHTSQRI